MLPGSVELTCNFCDKSESQVEVLVRGNNGSGICDGCAELALMMVRRVQRGLPASNETTPDEGEKS